MANEYPAVNLSRVCKNYGQALIKQRVLIDVELRINRGEFVVLFGRSGSGKSTLLNLIGAMDRPTSGLIEIDGIQISNLKERARTEFRRASLGFIFQAYNLIPTLTAFENVKLPLTLNGIFDETPALKILNDLGLENKAGSSVEDLSGGEQQRVAIGRALVHSPSLILADEPTGNLDIETGHEIIRLIDGLVRRNGQTLIMATHSQEVIGYADRVLTIRDRKVVEL
ncbi:MAG TPA: ABC transporter ATP-binding protein [Gammaproteobacteria bacterium]|nr:ABC transporter ATP-binding protein [Gammaproteobacteria bacterium]|tara:strand:+ start:1577 stop:2254 length:678 start_codon:yes stop_codon:yes gene_type:complete